MSTTRRWNFITSNFKMTDIFMKALAVGILNKIQDMFDMIERRKLDLRKDVEN